MKGIPFGPLYKRTKAKRVYKARRKFYELCQECGSTLDIAGRSWCKACLEKRKSNRKILIANGFCTRCKGKKKPLCTKTYCVECCIKSICMSSGKKREGLSSYVCLRTKDRNMFVNKLISKYNDQGGLDPYTKEKIIFGVNHNLDHIKPRSRGGTDELDNLQWTTSRTNRMKSDMTNEEFIELCGLVWKTSWNKNRGTLS